MTQEILKQNECRTLIFYVRDFLARHSQSLDEGKDLPMQEEPFSLKLPDWLQTNDLRIFSLKTYPVCFRMTKGGRFTPSSVRYLNWGMADRVHKSSNYYEALGIISEYVKTELSDHREQPRTPRKETLKKEDTCR